MQHGLLHDVHSYQDYVRLGRVSSSTLSICSTGAQSGHASRKCLCNRFSVKNSNLKQQVGLTSLSILSCLMSVYLIETVTELA
jgi:hypothetical protein